MQVHRRFDLLAAARQSMMEHGFVPDFPTEVLAQVAELPARPTT